MKRIIVVCMFAVSMIASAADATVAVRVGPPPPPRETVIVRPSPRHMWIAGHYGWDGRRYAWERGYWSLPPRGRAAWIPGRWDRRGGGYVWIQGYWR